MLSLDLRAESAVVSVPVVDEESNGLPAPDGPIYMVMQLDWPKTEPPSILPPGEGIWQPPGVAQVG
jgi:hypothetical protein